MYLGDELMRRFNGETLESLLNRLNLPDDVPIEAKMVSRAIKSAQTQVEQQNFEIRKNVLKYDEVMNQQRKVIYEERRLILEGENLAEQAHQMLVDVVTAYVDGATAEGYSEGYDMFVGMLEGLKEESVGFLFNVQVEAAPAPTVAPVAAPSGLAQFAAEAAAKAQDSAQGGLATKERPEDGLPAQPARALRAKGIEDSAPPLTYSGPSRSEEHT